MRITIDVEADGVAVFNGRYLMTSCPGCGDERLARLCPACLTSASGACPAHGKDLPEAQERRLQASARQRQEEVGWGA